MLVSRVDMFRSLAAPGSQGPYRGLYPSNKPLKIGLFVEKVVLATDVV